jgi:hypothetical protein
MNINKYKKKKYTPPLLSQFQIDNEISMVMMTYGDEGDPPPPPGPGASQYQKESPTKQNSFEDNPFGE